MAGAPPLPPPPDALEEIAVTSESGPNPVAVSGRGGGIIHGCSRGVTGP